jgi:3',5'-nucleoside bisphosphate phosphatase
MRSDLHLHTFVSDGALDPVALMREAVRWGITQLSIADHDALGAYTWNGGAVFEEARHLGLDLVVGIELDTELDGVEVHLLGYEVELDSAPLLEHLARVCATRRERAEREIGLVNERLGPDTLRPDQVFTPGRETLMRPHFIHPLLDQGRFPSYPEAARWFKDNIKSGIDVPKPPIATAISLVRAAGGQPVLAHPGYYMKAGIDILGRLPDLVAQGLQGVEVHYPYHSCSPRLFSAEDEAALRSAIEARARELALRITRGSDGHTSGDLERVYGALPSPGAFW